MYGYTEAEALKMNITQVVPPGKRKEEIEYLQRIASGEIVESFETQRITKNGKVLDIWLVVTCLKDDSGIIDSIATTERDITEIKNELRKKETEVKILMGLLPICASCKEIRDDRGYWHQIESYIRDHSEAEFTHGICPKCAEKLSPESKPRDAHFNYIRIDNRHVLHTIKDDLDPELYVECNLCGAIMIEAEDVTEVLEDLSDELGEYPDYRDRKIHEVLNEALFETPIDEDSPDFYNFGDMHVVLFSDNECECFGGPQRKPLTTVKMS
jgi:PAS domain S-box-containing protein